MKKEEAETVYEQLRQELGDEEAKKEVENARKYLERHTRGLGISVSWEDAILYLIAEKAKIKKEVKTGIDIFVKHSGKHWKIYYYPIGSFEDDLPMFGKFLEEVRERGEEVSAIIPNMGWVPASILLGTSFQGVKGFAVITRMTEEAEG
ncbi:MAG: hypothetical protein FGF52_04305 [Candidatus Brockarchaeota archaeon]|nr:hypothetical protein [Candidatus Brockarchaeota archaeon]